MSNLNTPGALVCRSGSLYKVSWHLTNNEFANSSLFTQGNPIFFIGRFLVYTSILLRRDYYQSPQAPDQSHNGLWTCRLEGEVDGAISVGLYQRGGGKKPALQYICIIERSTYNYGK